MVKIRKKILISLVLVISIVIVGLKSFAGVDKTTAGDVEDKRKFDDITVDHMINYVADNGSEWYNLDIGKIMASKLKSGGADYKKKYAYCIDPHTSTKGDNYYKIVNLIDIKNIDDVKVYGLNKDKDKIIQYSITGDQRKYLFDYSYLVYKSLHNGETDTKLNTSKGAYKISTTYYLWGHFSDFRKLGIAEAFSGDLSGKLSSSYYYKYIKSAYNNYTKDILKIKLKDKTDNDKLKSQTRIVNNQEKTYLGPYKVACDGIKIKNIKVTINGNERTYTKFASKVGGSLSDINKLKSNKNFYIVIDGKLDSKDKITEITMKTEKYKMFEARIALLDGRGECQNFEIFRAREIERDLKIKLPTPPQITETELKILKVDADDNNIVLKDVGFILKHSKYGYLKADRTYTNNENEAYMFKTDENGMVRIKNVNPGQYTFIEKENPYPEYKANEGIKVVFDYKETDTQPKVIKNKKKITKSLTIIKRGIKTDGSREMLSSVGFKLKHSTYGYVTGYKLPNGEIAYTSSDKSAKVFYTGNNGKITIDNLEPGQYTFIETVNPYPDYQLNINMEVKFELKEDNLLPIVIDNKQDNSGSLIISKTGIKPGENPIYLNNVKFKLKHSTEGYVKKSGSQISYTQNENEAYEFETGLEAGKDGQTQRIDNLKVGTYTIIETYNGNIDFKENEGKTTTFEVTPSTPSAPLYANIENPMDDMGNLRIIKTGNNGKRLSGVTFKLENNIYGYVYRRNGQIDYTKDVNSAETFTTDENGVIEIQNLKVGDYTLYEIYNPNKPYVTNPDLKFENVIVKSKETTLWNEFSVKNDSIRGNLKIIKEDEITKKPLKDVVFLLENKKEGYVQLIGEDVVVYTNNRDYARGFTTNESGIIEIQGLEVGEYWVHEIENRNEGYERYPTNLKFNATVNEPNDSIKWSEETYLNTPKRGKVTIEKKVKNSNVVMGGIGFILEHKEKGYVSSDGIEAEYTDDRNRAEIFYTGNDGKVSIEGLLPGEYNIYEVENDYYGFVINSDEVIQVINVPSGDDFLNVTIENKQKYIKLKGYVWEDHIAGKGSVPNDYYDGEGSQDNKKSGIGVHLKEGNTIIDSTVTDGNGAYEFKDVEVDKLGNYYIEFEYDGFVYTNVIPHIDADNGSKAAEPQSERSELNEKFNTIERGDNPDRQYGVAKDASGNPTLDLKYNYGDHKATIDEINKAGEEINPILGGGSNPVLITANTNETSYSIQNEYNKKIQTEIVEWIDNINLGIYEREQPDIALVKDIQSIKIIANKKIHVYEYANRFDSQTSDNSGRFGVEYGSKFKEDVYERPVYKEDYNCAIRDNNPTQFEVYITYKIALRNESTGLITRS